MHSEERRKAFRCFAGGNVSLTLQHFSPAVMCQKLSQTAEAWILSPAVGVQVESSKWRETAHSAALCPHTPRETGIQPHISEDHKSLPRICNRTAVTSWVIPPRTNHIQPQNRWNRPSFTLWRRYKQMSMSFCFPLKLYFHSNTTQRCKERIASAALCSPSWFLSALCLVGGENLSQTDFLGSLCHDGCLSGQSAGEALRSRWLTWQPPWITLLVKAHSQPSKVASFPPPFSHECADYVI